MVLQPRYVQSREASLRKSAIAACALKDPTSGKPDIGDNGRPLRGSAAPLPRASGRRFEVVTFDYFYASSRLNTTDALVPPKPKEFDSTAPIFTSSRRSRTIGMPSKAGSRFSMFALSQMKPLFIISSE